MKKFILTHCIHINMMILAILIILSPDNLSKDIKIIISSNIDKYLFGNIGLASDNNPILSKIVGNYVVILSILQGIVLYVYKVIPYKTDKKIDIFSCLFMMLLVFIGFYFTFFSNITYKVPPKPYISIPEDSLVVYWLAISSCLFLSTYGISMILYYLNKAVKSLF